MNKIKISIFIFLLAFIFSSCSKVDNANDKGVGPVKELKLTEINNDMVKEGEILFQQKCSTCHRLDQKLIGSALRGITNKRTPEWIMNMMLNPDGMINENKSAKELFEKMKVRMSPQNLDEKQARNILEYLRTQN